MAGKSWGNTKAPSRQRDKFMVDDYVSVHKYDDRKWNVLRIVGPVTSTCVHWFKIKTKEGKVVPIPKYCLNWNPNEESFDANGCPYCANDLDTDITYYTNAINRALVEQKPGKLYPHVADEERRVNIGSKDDPFKVFLKSKDSRSWTPIEIYRLPVSVVRQILDLPNSRQVKNGKRTEQKDMPVSDRRYGCDIQIKYDSKGTGSGKYAVQLGTNRKRLSDEEKAYLAWPLDFQEKGVETLEQATKEWKGLKEKLFAKTTKDNKDEKEEYTKKGKKGKEKYALEDDDDVEDNDTDSDDDDDDDDGDSFDAMEKKLDKKKKKKSGKSSKEKSGKKKGKWTI